MMLGQRGSFSRSSASSKATEVPTLPLGKLPLAPGHSDESPDGLHKASSPRREFAQHRVVGYSANRCLFRGGEAPLATRPRAAQAHVSFHRQH